MAETASSGLSATLRGVSLDKAVLATLLILLAVFIWDRPETLPVARDALNSLWHTAPFIVFAVLAVATLKATGAEAIVAKAFQGPPLRMITLAALVGGLAPFCSCEVIPFIAALLALGAPLGAVMAFWLASPLMDPAMFAITSAELGVGFAAAKTVAAVSIGFAGGLLTHLAAKSPVFADPLRSAKQGGCCGCGPSPFEGKPQWAFWKDDARMQTFAESAKENALFLFKWLLLAYVFEAVMVRYVPAEMVGAYLGGEGLQPILLGALVGGPAYLNGYAAVPLVAGLLDQGMAQGAAMSFVIAGGVSCIPAAVAVWALVKPRVFAAYIGFAFAGAVTAGMIWQAVA